MFDRIDAIVYKVSEYCNLDCVYCFQKYDTKTRSREFEYFDELLEFLKKLPLADDFEVKVTGGESSLHCDKIRKAYKKFKKLERYKECNISMTTISNGSNIDGLIDLWDDGILDPWGCKISWDGIYSASKSRKSKVPGYDDKFFNDTILKLGESPYSDKVLVRTACTPDTVRDLYAAYLYAYEMGIKKWEYYLLSDCDDYKDPLFLAVFQDQISQIFEHHKDCNEDKVVANIDSMLYVDKVIDEPQRLRAISCRHLGHFLHIGIDGSVYPCGYFSDDAFYEDQSVKIGDIFNGFDYDVLKSFNDEYNSTPMCSISEGCNCLHCFECPAISKFYKNHMQSKMGQQCQLRQIEKEVFDDIFKDYIFDDKQLRRNFTYSEDFKQYSTKLNEDLPFINN